MKPLSGEKLKACLGTYATGVAVITTQDPHTRQWYGMTVNSVASVSLNPPMLLWSIRKESKLSKLLQHVDDFVVNVLSARQKDLANVFARSTVENAHFNWERSEGASIPMLPDCLSNIECQITQRIDAGDHIVFLSSIRSAVCGTDEQPLLYGRQYLQGLPL